MVKISAWGTGAGVRLSRDLMKSVGFSVGQEVELIPNPNGVGVSIVPARPRLDLAALCAQVTPENMPDSIELGTMGAEKIDDDL